MDDAHGLREWLAELTDEQLTELTISDSMLRIVAKAPTGTSPRAIRRGLPRVRSWIKNASADDLEALSSRGATVMTRSLAGHDGADLDDRLTAALGDAGPVVGKVALHGLVRATGSEGDLAREHVERFAAAADGLGTEPPGGEPDVAQRLDDLVGLAEALAPRLVEAADAVRSGAATDGAARTAELLTRYETELRKLHEAVVGTVADETVPVDLPAMQASYEAYWAAAAAREQKRAVLEQDRAQLEALLSTTVSEAGRTGLATTLDAINAQIEDLDTDGAPLTEAVGGPSGYNDLPGGPGSAVGRATRAERVDDAQTEGPSGPTSTSSPNVAAAPEHAEPVTGEVVSMPFPDHRVPATDDITSFLASNVTAEPVELEPIAGAPAWPGEPSVPVERAAADEPSEFVGLTMAGESSEPYGLATAGESPNVLGDTTADEPSAPVGNGTVEESEPLTTSTIPHEPATEPPAVEVASAPGRLADERPNAPDRAPVDPAPPTGPGPIAHPAPEQVAANGGRGGGGPSSSETAEMLAFPWEAGSAPIVVRLLEQGRFAEAYWVTAASDEVRLRTDVLRFAASAFGTDDGARAELLLSGCGLETYGPDVLRRDHEAAVLAVVAAIRAGLVAGWAHSVLSHLDEARAALPVPWRSLVDSAVDALWAGRRIGPRATADGFSGDVAEAQPALSRTEVGDTARRLQQELPHRNIRYPRATVVLRYLLWDSQQLGELLALTVAWADREIGIERLEAAIEQVSGREKVESLIERADCATRTPQQARKRIVGAAKESLERIVEQVAHAAADAIAVERLQNVSSDATATLVDLAARIDVDERPPGVVGAALLSLRRWILEPDVARLVAVHRPVLAVSADPLLVLPDLPRSSDRQPDLDHPDSRRVLGTLADSTDPARSADLVEIYLDRGALDLAVALLDAPHIGMDPVADGHALVERAREKWHRRRRRHHAEVADLFAKVRAQSLLPADADAVAAGQLEALRRTDADTFDLAAAELDALRAELQAVLDQQAARLRDEIAGTVRESSAQARIERLLDDGDTVTAAEFLAWARSGEAVPDVPAEAVADLRDFVDGLANDPPDSDDPADWAKRYARPGDPSPSDSTVEMLRAWEEVGDRRRIDGPLAQRSLSSALRLIGLDCRQHGIRVVRSPRKGVQLYDVYATPRDGSYVAELGSEARGAYRVVLITEERRGRSLVGEDVDRASGVPHIVLYRHPLSLQARAELARESERTRVNAVVVDPPTVGWVAARAPGSFRATLRLVLPWSGYVPYRPYMAGLVPPEVFVGRAEQRRDVAALGGGMFVYGGRQLGKSALLRRVAAEFTDEGRIAVYLDLKGQGIGESRSPDRIWSAFATELKIAEVFPQSMSDNAQADVVVPRLRRWLEGDERRRVLLLADEADAFLTADSRGVPGRGGVQHFQNMIRLKQLMEATDRRFKVVFAGLHQVQRFRHLPNVPTVHGGQEILIGPLAPADARDLVVRPMAAMGIAFARPELVWRVLAATNYSPALVQIFCDELLARVRKRHGGATAMPMVVTEEDVDSTAADESVRALIAQRLRFTINLEDRYRVLALLIARKSLEDAFSCGYQPADLLEEAAMAWPDGFPPEFSEERLTVYLDEMVGLGLLVRLGGDRGYAARSPNVITMLGTRDDIARELRDADFDLPYEYNPRMARRLLARTRDGQEQRSPLTDHELEQLHRTATEQNGRVPLVAGTAAMTTERLTAALADYCKAIDVEVRAIEPDVVIDELTASSRSRSHRPVMVADLRGEPVENARRVLDVAARSARPSLVVVVLPAVAAGLRRSGDLPVLRPRRWTAESVRAWPECPYDTPELRRLLVETTGGWPELVESAVAKAHAEPRPATEVLAGLRAVPRSADEADTLLGMFGVDPELASTLATWAELVAPGDVLTTDDAAVALQVDVPTAEEILNRLDLLGILDAGDKDGVPGVVLDHVTHRCLMLAREHAPA